MHTSLHYILLDIHVSFLCCSYTPERTLCDDRSRVNNAEDYCIYTFLLLYRIFLLLLIKSEDQQGREVRVCTDIGSCIVPRNSCSSSSRASQSSTIRSDPLLSVRSNVLFGVMRVHCAVVVVSSSDWRFVKTCMLIGLHVDHIPPVSASA